MNNLYTIEENTRILIALLKKYGVKKIIASPGTKNVNFVGSIQNDPYFEVYSAADERSAAYMACGMAAESGECVCLSCTGATASRNYIPGLTEAFYRKLPVIAITSSQPFSQIGHNMDQVIDRRVHLNDMVCFSAMVPTIRCDEDRWECEIAINKALISTHRHGGGPVHINLETSTQRNFSIRDLPDVRRIYYYTSEEYKSFPKIQGKKIAIFVGNHSVMSQKLQDSITAFCEKYDAVVFCDRTSNYFGAYRVVPSIVLKQDNYQTDLLDIDLLIHIGNVSGSQFKFKPNQVWRVNPDGEIRDTYKKVTAVFETSEQWFFDYYSRHKTEIVPRKTYLELWKTELRKFYSLIPELPFSNLWVAQHTIQKLGTDCVIHLGILNSLRSWDYFDIELPIHGYSNTGGFGIDGGLSSLIGGALADPQDIHYGFIGDLAFFYDMNSLGNRHVPSNLRIILINNGRGVEFRKYNHPANAFGDDADLYMAAAWHYGNQSHKLVRHYAEDLGFQYLAASSKDEYNKVIDQFVSETNDRPIIFEIFTDYNNDSKALQLINNLEKNVNKDAKKVAKEILGDKGIKIIKGFLHS